jgi:hypothetical protein
VKISLEIIRPARQLLVGGDLPFCLLALLQDFLGLRGVLPEFRLACLAFERC